MTSAAIGAFPMGVVAAGEEGRARQSGWQLVKRQRARMRCVLAGGIALFVAGFAGFAISHSHQQHLLQTGRHTAARVVAVAPYVGGGWAAPNGLSGAHIDVQFADEAGQPVTARLGIGDYIHYRLGQLVEIVYDPARPSQAVFAHGYTDIGTIGFGFLAAIVLGFSMALFGTFRLLLWRRAARALREAGMQMTATSRYMRRSRFQTWAIALDEGSGRNARFWSAAGSGCSLLQQPTHVIVFGKPQPRAVVVAVDPAHLTAVAGRIPPRWRATDRNRDGAARSNHVQ